MLTPAWDTSCPIGRSGSCPADRWFRNCRYYEAEAARALRFQAVAAAGRDRHADMGELCGPGFFRSWRRCSGLRPATNVRHISEVFQLIPKGNSKSTNGGAVMLTAMIVNRRPEAEFLFVAPTMEIAGDRLQAGQRHDPARYRMLQRYVPCAGSIRKITHRSLGATLQIKAADTDVITGSQSHRNHDRRDPCVCQEGQRRRDLHRTARRVDEAAGRVSVPDHDAEQGDRRPGCLPPNWRWRARCATARCGCRCCRCCTSCRSGLARDDGWKNPDSGRWSIRIWAARPMRTSWRAR